MREVVPASVRELVRERVHTLEQLEILLLLYGDARRIWSADELATELKLSDLLVEAALAHLTHHGFVAYEAGRYHYAPLPPLQRPVELLARTYEVARPELLALLSSDAMGRVRRRMTQLRDRLKKN